MSSIAVRRVERLLSDSRILESCQACWNRARALVGEGLPWLQGRIEWQVLEARHLGTSIVYLELREYGRGPGACWKRDPGNITLLNLFWKTAKEY